PPGLVPQRIALEDGIAAIIIGPLGAIPEPVDLRGLLVLGPVPLVPLLPTGRVDLAVHEAAGVAVVVGAPAARVVDDRDVTVLIIGDPPVVDPAVAPGMNAEAIRILPVVFEVEGEAVLVGLLHQ